jgi:hypothetical protein
VGEIHDIVEQVRAATVWVADGPRDTGQLWGSGFFVAPGFAVTCAHVLAGCGPTPHLWWRGNGYPVTSSRAEPTDPQAAARGDYPDVALLAADLPDHPVVPIRDAIDAHEVWCYGATRERGGPLAPPEPDGRRLKVTNIEDNGRLELTGDAIVAGMSGGPVVDLAQFAVVGLTQSSLAEVGRKVAWASPIGRALALGTTDLWAANLDAREESLDTLRRDQVGLGPLPEKVADLIEGRARSLRDGVVTELGVAAPVVPDADLAEWVARTLFRLNLDQLAKLLKDRLALLGPAATEVFELVACCLPADEDDTSVWVPGDAVESLRGEYAKDRPRVLHLPTDQGLTARLLLVRTLAPSKPNVIRCAPPASATSVGGTNAEQLADVTAALAENVGSTPEEWVRLKLAARMRKQDALIDLVTGEAPDTKLLAGLRQAFPGLAIVVRRRSLSTQADAESELRSVLPAPNADHESAAVFVAGLFNKALIDQGLPEVKGIA